MSSNKQSGQAPFTFELRSDLYTLPQETMACEVDLHGGFATDPRADFGHIYYGMPGCGILRIDPDMSRQELIKLPDDLKPLNFHSTKIGQVDGQWRLFMPANSDEKVVVISLDGDVDFVLPRPEFEQYQSADVPFNPTDTTLSGDQLYVADGYGSNYISSANVTTQQWTGIFGGKTEDATEDGKFATAHGISLSHTHEHLVIADRPSARMQLHKFDGEFMDSHKLPPGAWPCGINYFQYNNHWYAVIGSLRDPVENRPAPIYIVDAATHDVVSTIRPKDELGIDLVQHLHNVIWHDDGDHHYLVCQAWNPGHYFVLEMV